MLYLSGSGGYAWYASFRKGESWAIDDEFRVTRQELLDFEGRGSACGQAPGVGSLNGADS